MPLRAADIATVQITHEVVTELDHLPVYFASTNHKSPNKWPRRSDRLTIPIHWHEYIEFIYLLDGHMTAIVQADTYELQSGDLLVINSEDLHMTRVTNTRSPYILLQISADRLRESFLIPELVHFNTHVKKEELNRIPAIRDSLFAMSEIYYGAEDGYRLAFISRLYEFLYELYRNFSTQSLQPQASPISRDLKRVSEIVDWTRENFRRPLTLDDAAAQLGISREYFCRIFKKYAGQTYLEYLCTVRTMNLYEDLRRSDLSIPLLMEQNGLSNYKTFIRTFKELYGITPQKARRLPEYPLPKSVHSSPGHTP